MDLSSFSENIVTIPYERNGGTVHLRVNIDAMLPEYFDALEERLAPLMKRAAEIDEQIQNPSKKKNSKTPSRLQLEKQLLEMEREAHAERLTCPVTLPDGSQTCLLKGWDLTKGGAPLSPSKEVLVTLHPRVVAEFSELCLEATKTVKKRVAGEDEETTENTHSGSKELRVVGQTT